MAEETQKKIANIEIEEEFEGNKFKYYDLKLSDDEKKDLAQKILGEINQAQTDFKAHFENIQAWRDLANGKVEERNFPWDNATNVCLPIIATKIRIFVGRGLRILLGPASPFLVKPGSDDEIKKAPKIESFLNWLVKVELKLKGTLRRAFKKLAKDGTVIIKPHWVRETEIVRDIIEYKDIEKFKDDYPSAKECGIDSKYYKKLIKAIEDDGYVEFPVEYEEVTYEGVKIDVIDREDFIVPYGTIDNQTALFNAQQMRRRYFQLKAMEIDGVYENVDELLPRNFEHKEDGEPILIKNEDAEFYVFEVIRKYPAFKNNKDLPEKVRQKPVDCIFTIGVSDGLSVKEHGGFNMDKCNGVMLRAIIYPYYHGRRFFIPMRMEEGDGFDGIGLAQKLYDLNIEANFYHNARMDSLLLATAISFKARRGSSVDVEEQHFYPGAMMWVDHMADLEQLEIRSQGAALVPEQEMMQRQCELHSGITDYSSGKESSTDPRAPAAKAMMLLQETNLSINEYVDCLRESVTELAFQIINLYFQYMPHDMKYKVLKGGRDIFDNITRQVLRARKAEYITTGSTAEENKYLERTELMELVGFLMKFPMVAGNEDGVRYLLERVIDKYDIKGISNVLPSEKEVKEKLIKIQQEAMKRTVDEKFEQMQSGGQMLPPPAMGGMQ